MSELKQDAVSVSSGAIGTRWTWLIDIVFGGIVVLGYEKLEEALVQAIATSLRSALALLFLAICLLAFLVYDVAIYHLLTTIRPFQPTLLSACRYGLDIAMTLALTMIVIPPLSIGWSNRTGITLLVSATLWHLCAALWHVLAALEAKDQVSMRAILPHLVAVAVYWSITAGLSAAAINLGSSTTVYVISAAMLLFSLWRAPQIVRLYSGLPTRLTS